MKRIILGDGLLGKSLHEMTGWDFISRKKDDIIFEDINSYSSFLMNYDEIINCIAFTDTYSEDKEKNWNINYKGVADLVDFCNENDKKLIQISTSYVYANSKEIASEEDVPVHCETWYGYTKLLGDGHVQLKSKNYLMIREMHKKCPFPYEYAFINQVGNFDYVSVISDLIIKLIEKNAIGVFNVGTELKTMFDLAKKTKADVKPICKLFNEKMPTNISMNIEKMKKFLEI